MWVDFFQTRPYLSLDQVITHPIKYFDFPLYRIWRKNGQMARNNRHQWKRSIHKFCKWSLSHQTSKRFSHTKESSLKIYKVVNKNSCLTTFLHLNTAIIFFPIFFKRILCHRYIILKNSVLITLWLNVLLFLIKY